jgi:hypothetical protein
MSLEQQIADAAAALGGATAAANTLTGTVSAKIGQIDTAVVAATQAIDAKWAAERDATLVQAGAVRLWLDHINGNDSNDGITAPVKTFARLKVLAELHRPTDLTVTFTGGGVVVVDTDVVFTAARKLEINLTGVDGLRFSAFIATDTNSEFVGHGSRSFTFSAPLVFFNGNGQPGYSRKEIIVDPVVAYDGSGEEYWWLYVQGALRGSEAWCVSEMYLNMLGCSVDVGTNATLLARRWGRTNQEGRTELLKIHSVDCSYALATDAYKTVGWADIDGATSWT